MARRSNLCIELYSEVIESALLSKYPTSKATEMLRWILALIATALVFAASAVTQGLQEKPLIDAQTCSLGCERARSNCYPTKSDQKRAQECQAEVQACLYYCQLSGRPFTLEGAEPQSREKKPQTR